MRRISLKEKIIRHIRNMKPAGAVPEEEAHDP